MKNNDVLQPAIIILRHACDGGHSSPQKLVFDPSIDVLFNKDDPSEVNGNTVYIRDNWLGDDGLERAKELGKQLPNWINSNFSPVNTVITEGPGDGTNGTPNPINTIAPSVENLVNLQKNSNDGKIKLLLRKDNTYDANKDVFSAETLFGDGSHSTVICWEALGMWRKGKDQTYDENLLLGSLAKDPHNPLLTNYSPAKGQTIYVYTNYENGKFDLNVYNFDGTKFNECVDKIPSVACLN